jgi:hypothetical protein
MVDEKRKEGQQFITIVNPVDQTHFILLNFVLPTQILPKNPPITVQLFATQN